MFKIYLLIQHTWFHSHDFIPKSLSNIWVFIFNLVEFNLTGAERDKGWAGESAWVRAQPCWYILPGGASVWSGELWVQWPWKSLSLVGASPWRRTLDQMISGFLQHFEFYNLWSYSSHIWKSLIRVERAQNQKVSRKRSPRAKSKITEFPSSSVFSSKMSNWALILSPWLYNKFN